MQTSMTTSPKRRGRPRSPTTSKFSAWLDAAGITRDMAADKLGVSRAYIDRLARGESRPSLPLAAKIDAFSKGAVALAAWVPGASSPSPSRRRRP